MINLLISANDCANSALENILTVVRRILLIIQIVGPIILIISLLINITKVVTNPDEKKNTKKIINSIIAIIVMFMTPVLINAVMYALGESFTISECWNNISTNNENNDNNTDDSPKYIDPYNDDNRTKIYAEDEDDTTIVDSSPKT